MDLERLLARCQEIQRIPSPTFCERERAAYMRSAFEQAKLSEIACDEMGNLYGKLPGGDSQAVIVSAHLDSVFPLTTPLPTHRTQDRLIGPGIGDNAVALSALVELAMDFQGQALPGDLWLVANVCEEGLGNSRGMREVVARFGDQVAAYLVIEGMCLGRVIHRGLPIRRLRITVQTQGGHSWIHAGRPSALHTLTRLAAELVSLPLKQEPRTTLNIGRIDGGTSINSIASTAYLELDLRSEDPETLDALVNHVTHLTGEYNETGVALQITSIGDRPGGGIPEDHPLVIAAKHAFESVDEADLILEAASTDASIPLSMGLPAVCIGLTRGGEAHSENEFIEIDPLRRGYPALVRLIHACFDLSDSE
ncbi:MAG: M20/M25/M40 family metallo-hydrolase [Anaerolineales bacterium]|jgi:acetylornithine deacetylase/succinyl-diaminopimelate desuccinylase-like protein